MLEALATICGAHATNTERLPDDRRRTEAGIEGAIGQADIVVIAGGVSVGPHDHVKPALEALGVTQQFWGVALQPGKPTWFGARGGKLVFGLPGNPVSAYVTFVLFVAPVIAGVPPAREARLGQAVRQHPDREQALRVRLDANGAAIPNGHQGSHVVSSLLNADALAMIPAGKGELPAGATVTLERLPH